MKRRIAISFALLITWICYGLAVVMLADNEAGMCHQFGDLAIECSAPFLRFFLGVSILFVLATVLLGVFAWRSSPISES